MMSRLVRASEIGEYVYCQRAWWLNTMQGRVPTRTGHLRRGTEQHARHGQRLSLSNLLLIIAVLVLVGGIFALWW